MARQDGTGVFYGFPFEADSQISQLTAIDKRSGSCQGKSSGCPNHRTRLRRAMPAMHQLRLLLTSSG